MICLPRLEAILSEKTLQASGNETAQSHKQLLPLLCVRCVVSYEIEYVL